MADIDEATWAEIRRLYETSDMAVGAIATRFGITMRRLYDKRRAEGWPQRCKMTDAMLAEARQARGVAVERDERAARAKAAAASEASTIGEPTAGKRRKAARRDVQSSGPEFSNRALMSRMMRLAERNLSMMERYMAREGKHSAEDCERSTRTVGTLVKTIEKVTELQPPDDDTSVTTEMAANATAELRRELAERLYRMWGGAKR